jgi:hypothetical protein
MTLTTLALAPGEMLALGVAFESACEDLGIGISSLDVSKRERIARLILGFIAKGEGNPEVLRRRVVLHFRNTPQPIA